MSVHAHIKIKNKLKKKHKKTTKTRMDSVPFQAMKEALEIEANEKVQKDHDCFVLFILAHGARDVILGIDGGQLDITKYILAQFDSENCKNLIGKPKLFFIGSCQVGNDIQLCI